jgi:PTS system nitrogen regulatory IIA component
MDLTRLQVETLLNVSSDDLDMFISRQNLPCYSLGHEKRFDLLEIEAWLLKHQFWNERNHLLPFNLYRALARGGYYCVDDLGDASILKLGAYHLGQKLGIDPEGLYALLQAREALSSTALGKGCAIPHPRERIEGIKQDMLFIIHLNHPIEFNAIDQQKVHTFFFLLAGSDKSHLNLLSKLVHLINQDKLKTWLGPQSTHTELLKTIADWEQSVTNTL